MNGASQEKGKECVRVGEDTPRERETEAGVDYPREREEGGGGEGGANTDLNRSVSSSG